MQHTDGIALKPRFETLNDVYKHATESFGPRPLYGTKTGGTWRWMTYSEFAGKVDRMRGGLAKLGIERGDRVAIISDNRAEWAVAAYATYGLGGAFVPMYENQLPKEWKFILEDSGSRVLFVANREIADRVATFIHEMAPSRSVDHPRLRSYRDAADNTRPLQHVVLIEGEPLHDHECTFESLLSGEPAPLAELSGDDIAGFIYTSGTTGSPKGVLLSHSNFAKNVSAIHAFFPMSPEDRSLSFLPWAHSFGQTCELHGLYSMGASMAIAEAVDKIVANLAEVQPTLLFSVPRIFNRIYDGLNKKMRDAGGLKLKLFTAAMANEEERKRLSGLRRRSGLVDFKHNVFDKLVFSKVRETFGGRLRYAFSGGAALSVEVAQFVDNLGITVYEGYGLTETSPIASANSPSGRKIGSVGRPIPGIRISIDNDVTGDPKHGEIIISGHNVMQGYYGLDEENARVLSEIEGEPAFRTGDMGYLDDEGFLFISGRIKEQYKLVNGKYVVPTPLEEKLKLSPYISSVMIYGANKLHNVALIVPDFEVLKGWAKDEGLSTDQDALLSDPKVRALFRAELDQYSSDFKAYEQVRNFLLIAEDFTQDNGMLTPTLKLKRRVVLQSYQGKLDELYS